MAQIQCNSQSDSKMLKMVHKFAHATSGSLAKIAHGTHARIDNCGRATKGERKCGKPRKMLVLHNARETLTDCLIGGYALVHDLYGQNVTTIYHKYAMSV